jgi:multidrug efflux system outer membrane protein
MNRCRQMKKPFKIFALVVILALTGCMMGPDFQKPVMETPDKFRQVDQEADVTLNLKWWELFNDPVLNALVVAALEDNKDVKIAASRIEEARASLGFTKGNAFPRVDIEAEASRGNLAGRTVMGSPDNVYYIAPVVSWEIDFWGKFRRATEAARAELMASMFSLRTVQIGLIAEVVSTYFLLLDYHQRLEISRQTLKSRIDSLDIIQKRFDKGIIPEIDLNQAQIQKEIAAAAIPVQERLISRTENTISILLGRFPGEVKSGIALHKQTVPPDIPVGLPSSLLERRPDIVRAERLLAAQTARIGVAQSLRLPSISLTGILGLASNELSDLTSNDAAWSVSAGLFGPIFNFDQDRLRVEVERERTKQALFNYENTVLLAFREVEDALKEIQTYKKQLSAVERKAIAAKNAAYLSRLRYDKGFSSFLEVLETERTLFSVELEYSELKQQFLNAYVKLYKALGGGWLYQEEMEQTQAQPETPKTISAD